MILHGRYLSPFVRRVAIWLNLQQRTFKYRPIAVLGEDFGELKKTNPFGRAPALELASGEVLVDTYPIIDYLEDTAAADRRLLPAAGIERMRALQGIARANNVAEKGVALAYETVRRPEALHWADWIARVEGQVVTGLELLEARAPDAGFLGGEHPGGMDAAAVSSFDYVATVFPRLLGARYPNMQALSERANALAAFADSKPS